MESAPLAQLEQTSSALQALAVMVTDLIASGDDHHHIAEAIFDLFDAQCKALTSVHAALREEGVAQVDVKDAAFIAKLTGLSMNEVKTVIWATYGIDADPFTDTMLKDDDFLYETFRRKLRDASLVERARGTVSEWSGIAPEIVNKVLHAAGEAATEFMYRTHKGSRSPEALKDEADLLAALRKANAGGKSIDDETARKLMQHHAGQAALDHQSEKMGAELAGYDPQLSPDELRAKFIADSMRRGIEVDNIAQALNMKLPAVEKLVAKMTGQETLRREPPQDKAANG